MPERPASKLLKLPGKGPRVRRATRRRGQLSRAMRQIVTNESFVPVLFLSILLSAALTLMLGYVRGRPVLAVGRIMDETRTVRVDFTVTNEEETQRRRDLARLSAPLVFKSDAAVMEQIGQSLRTLPTALAVAETLEQVAPEYREPFRLTEEQFAAAKAEATGGEATERWISRVDRLMRQLGRLPLLSKEDFQAMLSSGSEALELRQGENVITAPRSTALSIDTEDPALRAKLESELLQIAEGAGFFGPRAQIIVQRLMVPKQPTFRFDREATQALREQLAVRVQPVHISYLPGQVLYARGETLSEAKLELVKREMAAARAQEGWLERTVHWGGMAGLAVFAVLALVSYLATFYSRVLQRPWRLVALSSIVVFACALSLAGAMLQPDFMWLALAGPVVFFAMMIVVAYDARLAIVVSTLVALCVTAALHKSVGTLAAMIAGASVASWHVRDIRNRNDVVRAGVMTALTLVVAAVVAAAIDRPLAPGVMNETLKDALLAGAAGFFAGALSLVVLPTVERLFDIVTGMTLTEWRDPRQPLLRELQSRAPGTFNHSHTVATLAESAADVIGADSLHVYVGALYHDIGKMNKPDYFIENQAGGFNKHSKLSPAMSLLVIVGHVKDGIELAREYGLPRSLHHYIESHHGTTLVEYFYDQARKQAGQDGQGEAPQEIEYRYPGPKPRSKEAAILMICDAVESATRAMSEPTPARISALVHALATKRLHDGQFDECNMTLGELNKIEEAITKTLCSIYHGRIAYPAEARTQPPARTSTAATRPA